MLAVVTPPPKLGIARANAYRTTSPRKGSLSLLCLPACCRRAATLHHQPALRRQATAIASRRRRTCSQIVCRSSSQIGRHLTSILAIPAVASLLPLRPEFTSYLATQAWACFLPRWSRCVTASQVEPCDSPTWQKESVRHIGGIFPSSEPVHSVSLFN